jgi:signal transduction histidine kinase
LGPIAPSISGEALEGRKGGLSAFSILLLLAAITAGLLWVDPVPASLLRYGYLVPAFWGALRFGRPGGVLVGFLAVLLYAPVALPAVAEQGLNRETAEGLLFLAWLGGVGPLAGALVSDARAKADRYDTLLALQRRLAAGAPLDRLLTGVAEQVRASLRADAVTLVMAGGEVALVRRGKACASTTTIREDSAAAWAWRERRSLFIADLESDPRFGGDGLASGRPRRAFVVPLHGQGEVIGVMVVERVGELPRAERRAIGTLALQLGLGIENARLTERQRRFAEELEGKVAAATRRLRELDRAKSDFVSVVSHELRTPLTSIRGFTELLLNRAVLPERQHQFLGYVLHESERLGRIVEDLLDLSRIEAGREQLRARAPVDLAPLLEVNAELFACQSPLHEVRATVSEGLPPVLADRDAVDRVLKNLLSNAIKYSPRGGLVWLRAAPSPGTGGFVEISVEDQGVGIPPEAIGRIFDKYYRLSHPETARARGLGIGLALVKSLVEAHGGTVEATSAPGQGSCFRVTLPAVTVASA